MSHPPSSTGAKLAFEGRKRAKPATLDAISSMVQTAPVTHVQQLP